MFATLLGGLPRPPADPGAPAGARLDAVVAVQVDHGLEPVTGAGWDDEGSVVDGATDARRLVTGWRATRDRTDRLVKATILGPWSAGSTGKKERDRLLALVDAGCTWIEVHEPAAVSIGTDPEARARFAGLHRALTADLAGVHLSLAITGGNADAAGIDTILAGAYSSLALDLISGPDNWRLAVAAPADRGVVVGALAVRAGSDDGPELLIWAAGYAASTGGRGMARVGLATSGSLADLPWDVAVAKVRRLGEAARLVEAPREVRRAAVDPRAIDPRSAALGRDSPRPERRPEHRDP